MSNSTVRRMSSYRQFKLQATHESGGMFSYRIYAKGLNDGWNERCLLVHDTVHLTDRPLRSTEDVILALIALLDEQLLPPHVE
jgi:hypothetical protein